MPAISLRQAEWQRTKRRLRIIQRNLGATESQFRASLPAFAVVALAVAQRLAPIDTGRLRRNLAYSIIGSDVQLGTNDLSVSGVYIGFQELGTRYILPRRFILRAFRAETAILAFQIDLRRRVQSNQGIPLLRRPGRLAGLSAIPLIAALIRDEEERVEARR